MRRKPTMYTNAQTAGTIALTVILGATCFLYRGVFRQNTRSKRQTTALSPSPFQLRLRLEGVSNSVPDDIQMSSNSKDAAILTSELLLVKDPFKRARCIRIAFEGDATPLTCVWITELEIAVFLSCGIIVTLDLSSVRGFSSTAIQDWLIVIPSPVALDPELRANVVSSEGQQDDCSSA